MIWLIGIGALAVGVIIGVVSAGKLGRTDTARIQELEKQLDALQHRHDSYRASVSEHFSTTAELIHNMTESYRDVYQHLAGGAQQLCSEEVADKMLPGREESPLFSESPRGGENDSGAGEAGDEQQGTGTDGFRDTAASSEPDYGVGASEKPGLGDEERTADRT